MLASLVSLSCMEASAQRSGFKPYVGEGFISPYRQLVIDLVKDLFTDQPSFARAIQKRCLGPAGRLALPVTFMSKYLIGSQGQIMLEGQDGVPWKIDWIAYMQSGRRLAFTHGWHAFVSHYKIKHGDIFIAEIVAPEHWKAHFVSAESGYTRKCTLQLGHNVELTVDNEKESCTEDGIHCNKVNNKMHHIPTSSLPFLEADNRITRRKRSGKRKSRERLHSFAESPLKTSRENCKSVCVEESLCSDSDDGSLPSLNDSVQQVSALVKSDEIFDHVVEKTDDKENFLFHSKEILMQSCFPHRGDANFKNTDIGKSFNRNEAYEVRYCQSLKEQCHHYVLHGFQHCILHILEDASAPYKQCDFMDGLTYSRCGFPVCLNIVDTRFCQIHSQHDVAPDIRNPGHALWNILPKLGDLSLMMMAAIVAHQSHKEADFWVLRNFQVSHTPCKTKGNFKSDLLIEGRMFRRDGFTSPEQNLSMVDVQLFPAKVNEENIVQYLGWKFHAANKADSEMVRHVDDRSENDSSIDGVNERIEGSADGQNPIPCAPLSGSADGQNLLPCPSLFGNSKNVEKRGILGISSGFAVDRTSFTGQERTLCAMHVHGKHISFSRFVGIRKRPWDVSDCEIHDREHRWHGNYPKQEGTPSDAAAASSLAVFGQKEHRPLGDKIMNACAVKKETDEVISDASKNQDILFVQRTSFDGQGVDGFMCLNLSLITKDDTLFCRQGRPRFPEVDGSVGTNNATLYLESNDSFQCPNRIMDKINGTSAMATDLTLASTYCKEEHYSSSREKRIPFGPLKPKIATKNTKTENVVNHADSTSLVPEGLNVQYATRTQMLESSLTVHGVQKYEVQSDDSVDSIPEESRVTSQLYKRFLNLNDSQHGRKKLFHESGGI